MTSLREIGEKDDEENDRAKKSLFASKVSSPFPLSLSYKSDTIDYQNFTLKTGSLVCQKKDWILLKPAAV
jgi:hypothetical protein